MAKKNQNIELVNNLKRSGYICSEKVEQAFLTVDRELFVPASIKKFAYIDNPLEIGNGQTISAPHMVAIMAEALDIKSCQNILEIGTGSGYHAAIVSYLAGTHGHIHSIERIHLLAVTAKKNLQNAKITTVEVHEGDGSLGLQQYEPYDRIYVTCAAPSIPPPLTEQLIEGGKLLIPVGRLFCELKLVEKRNKTCIIKDLGGCAFVPLIGTHGFKS
jgi:protein-L-isoaspartate(D-aspartate) O-methyltransferase